MTGTLLQFPKDSGDQVAHLLRSHLMVSQRLLFQEGGKVGSIYNVVALQCGRGERTIRYVAISVFDIAHVIELSIHDQVKCLFCASAR